MEPTNPFPNADNGKTAGIISYFTIVGWLIAYFAFHQNNKTSLGSYQLRQTLLFHIGSIVLWFGLSFVFSMIWVSTGIYSFYYLFRIVQIGLFILWIIGLIGAINGDKKPIPLIGDRAQTMFPGI